MIIFWFKYSCILLYCIEITLRKNANSWSVIIPLDHDVTQDQSFDGNYSLYCRQLNAGGKWNRLQCDFDFSKRFASVPGSLLGFGASYEFRFRLTYDHGSSTSDPLKFCPIAHYGTYIFF